MNAADRKEISRIIMILDQTRSDVETLRDAQQEIFDNMSEGKQEGESGEKLSGQIEHLTEAVDTLENVVTSLDEAKGE